MISCRRRIWMELGKCGRCFGHPLHLLHGQTHLFLVGHKPNPQHLFGGPQRVLFPAQGVISVIGVSHPLQPFTNLLLLVLGLHLLLDHVAALHIRLYRRSI